MSIASNNSFEYNIEKLKYLIDLRYEERKEIDQKYVTIDTIINRLNVIKKAQKLDGNRILALGDGDLTALSIAIFGTPSEVVAADIDQRLSEIYFEANMKYDLPVRYLYHDMRLKIIEILLNQYSLIIFEPPFTKEGVEVFLSRAVQCLQPGYEDGIFISIPHRGSIREFFDFYTKENHYKQVEIHPKLNFYKDNHLPTDFVQLEITEKTSPTITRHWIYPFFEDEVKKEVHEYKCICKRSILVGKNQTYTSINQLERVGCTECGYHGKFAYQSQVELK